MSIDTPGNDRSTDVVIDATATGDCEFGTVVVNAVAEQLGTDPTALPPIGESIDPDVLNEFRDAGGASATALSFEYLGYEVVVTGDGIVQLRSLA